MATTVAVNYGSWWRVYGTSENIGKWLRDNKVAPDKIISLGYDSTNSIFELMVYGNNYSTSV